jgi:hypothetical protein
MHKAVQEFKERFITARKEAGAQTELPAAS